MRDISKKKFVSRVIGELHFVVLLAGGICISKRLWPVMIRPCHGDESELMSIHPILSEHFVQMGVMSFLDTLFLTLEMCLRRSFAI